MPCADPELIADPTEWQTCTPTTFTAQRPLQGHGGRMYPNRQHLDQALAILGTRLPAMLSRYSNDDEFGVAFGRAAAVIESEAGGDLAYARRSIDRLLALQIIAGR